MTITEFKQGVIALFKSGGATESQWEEMAEAVLTASESVWDAVPEITQAVDPEEYLYEGDVVERE